MSFDLKLQNGDLSVSSSGDIATVEGGQKLEQDILKVIMTKLGSNPFFPWYGSPIEDSLVGMAYTDDFVAATATSQLQTCIERIQQLQKEQLKNYQIVTPAEQIAAIQNIHVERNITDPRFFSIVITVISKAFQQQQISLLVSL